MSTERTVEALRNANAEKSSDEDVALLAGFYIEQLSLDITPQGVATVMGKLANRPVTVERAEHLLVINEDRGFMSR